MICETCTGDGLINQHIAGGAKVCKDCSGTGKVVAGSIIPDVEPTVVEETKEETTETTTEPEPETETENTEANKSGLIDRILGN